MASPHSPQLPALQASRSLSRELAAALVARLALEVAPLQTFRTGVQIVWAGEPTERLPIVVEGRLDSVLRLQGNDGGYVIPVSFEAGEIVLLSQLFNQIPTFVDLVVGEPAVIRWVSKSAVEKVLIEDPSLMTTLVQFLVQRLREVQSRERAWVERGVHERVCATLTRLAHEAVKGADGTVLITATHEELASRSGVSRPKLSQELKRLEQAGRLRLERGSVRVVDLSSLFDPAT